MKLRHNIFTLSLFFGLLLYLIDALMDSVIYHTGSFWSSLFAGVPLSEIRERMVMVGGFLAFGILVSRILAGRRRAEEALRRNEEEAKREGQENAIMAEIGQIISSTLNLEEVYMRFAEAVRKLIQFDRMAIHILNPQDHTFSITFVLGPNVAEREVEKVVAWAGTATEWVLQNRSSLRISEENGKEVIGRLPGLLPLYEAGFRSMMFTPLISKDQVIGLLNIQTVRQSAYTERDLKLAEKVSMQISGAIANAQLFQEQRRAEEALAERTAQLERTNRELVAVNAELDDFTNVASHDLQEPLRTLTAFSDMLRKDLDQSLPEKAAQDVGFITDAAKRMQTLIQDLLALSRAGRVAKKREKVSLGECADLALEALAIRMKETGARVTRDELPEVWGDSTLLTQLYQNLIGNALKFCGDQAPIIRLTVEERDGSPVFGVKDNGIGIESKYAQQIFQPFRRLHSHAQYEGSGIGLAICRKIVERHGGKIWVDSEPGKGAHFRFTITHRRRG
jgi:signal transduction histidine kinase